ncbi:MAG: hypothetical protein AB7V14_12485 [Kiritimatiellia bacterium]
MPPFAPIFLAASDGSGLDLLIWIAAAAFWFFAQAQAAKKKKDRKAPRDAQPPRPPAARPGGGEAPTPDELAEIFRRLGGQIPATPPPAPRVAPPAPSPAARVAARPVSRPLVRKTAAPRVQPEIARRLARARQEADEAARQARAIQAAENAIVPGVQSRAGEHRSLDTATRHTGMILPRLYAMSMRLANLPSLPMPALAPAHREALPLRARLRSRRELRNAIVAQAFLSPCKSASL